MKLLFIQGGSRVRVCSNNTFYVDGNFNNDIWNRYNSYCDELTVILRKIDNNFYENEVKHGLNKINTNLMNLCLVYDIYSPKKNFFNIKKRCITKKIIEKEVKKSDKIIIRSIGNFYTNTALKYCEKYKKDYLIEVTGFALDSLWYHSFLGKIVAIPREIVLKKSLKKSPYAVYVTDIELQKRYPSSGKMLGCSDVELFEYDKNILLNKIKNIKKHITNNNIIIGTAGFLDVSYKGQKDVIKAINYLKKNGYDNIYYEMIGTGSGKKLKKLIEKYNLKDKIKIVGALKRDAVKDWMSNLDIYVHPSYTEGLCRSIIESMSLACPIICSNAGGNKELINKKYIYPKKNWKKLAKLLINMIENDLFIQAKVNFHNSKKYRKEILDKKRDTFYKEFIEI